MPEETAIKQILDTVSGQLDTMLKQKEEDKAVIKALTERLDEVEKRYATLKTLRKVGLDSGLPFTGGEPEDAHKFLQWFKAVVTHDEDTIKAVAGLNSIAGGDGGYLVPDDWQPRIVRIIETYGLARKLATRIPMKHDRLSMPTLTNGVNVYWGSTLGANGGQNQEIPESQPSFGEVSLTIDDLYCLVPISNQLLDDAEVDVANLIVTLMAEATAKEEDRVAFVGDDTDPFTGVVTEATNIITISGATYASINADDLASMIESIDGPTDNAVYMFHPTVFNSLRTLKDDNGNYIYQAPQSGEPGTIWGFPYIKSKTLPSTASKLQDNPFVIFGDFKNLYFADRMSMAIATSTHVGFKKNQTYIRMVERIGFKIALPSTFAILRTSLATTTTS